MTQIPLASKSDPGRSKAESGERLLNFYAEAQKDGKSPFALYATPGMTAFSTPSDSPCRGLEALSDRILSVHFDVAVTVNSAGASTLVGVVPGTDRVIMARNQHIADDGTDSPQVAIAAGTGYYVYEAGIVNFIVEDFLVGIQSVETIDGFTIIALLSGKFYWSALNDAKTINPLNFATAEGSPDSLLRVIRFRREAWFFGTESTEIWQDTGNSESQFERLPGAVLDIGIMSKYAACRMGSNLYFIDSAKQVRQVSSGYGGQRISNFGCEAALRSLTNADDVEMFGYTESGHEFLVVKSPTFTWVWDSATGLWHERQTTGLANWQAQSYVRAFNKHIVGSTASGKLLSIEQDTMDEDGLDIIGEATTPPASDFPKGGILNMLDVDVESGVGIGAASSRGQDVDPSIMLAVSIDNGKTFRLGKKQPLGKMGACRQSVRFTRMGAMDRQGVTFRLSVSARVVRAIIQLNLSVTQRNN